MLLMVIVFIGALLRFYNLMWGNGYFFHPDENNMARSIVQMSGENGFHPDFFAYGQFPLYLSYFSAFVQNVLRFVFIGAQYSFSDCVTDCGPLPITDIDFAQSIFFLRIWSAIFSVGTIIVVYFLTKQLINHTSNKENTLSSKNTIPLLSALFVAFTPGLIQSAHFGTTESVLTFLFVTIIYFSIKQLYNQSKKNALFIGFFFGMALAIKLSAIYFICAPVFLYVINIKRSWKVGIKLLLITSITAFATSLFTSPYNFIDYPHFFSTIAYETSVMRGTIQVFYTRQFIDTTPFLFQIVHIFPYALGLPQCILGILGIVYAIKTVIKKPRNNLALFIVLIAFFGYITPMSFLYAKWTRNMVPILPFFSIFAAFSMYTFKTKINKNSFGKILYWCLSVLWWLLIILSLLTGIRLFSIYTRTDTRIQASKWIHENIPENSYILSETANVVDIPVDLSKILPTTYNPQPTTKNYTVVSFNFYELDELPQRKEELINHLVQADYILVPSRRIFANHLGNAEYPSINSYYESLLNNMLGFELAALCDTHCYKPKQNVRDKAYSGKTLSSIIMVGDEQAEETWSVFDHPTVRIYKKAVSKSKEEYERILFSK